MTGRLWKLDWVIGYYHLVQSISQQPVNPRWLQDGRKNREGADDWNAGIKLRAHRPDKRLLQEWFAIFQRHPISQRPLSLHGNPTGPPSTVLDKKCHQIKKYLERPLAGARTDAEPQREEEAGRVARLVLLPGPGKRRPHGNRYLGGNKWVK
ncbi:unnamed protein product [Nezara viridula]|uniref:Uncharacterized protein n=1 Tax=Nezara viridula TaxID=85310 RepID=A0A9P0HBK7_NEZVI|nr:unnamed protein product [Nezara viridula]